MKQAGVADRMISFEKNSGYLSQVNKMASKAKAKTKASVSYTHFKDFPEKWKKFCFALVSCNYLLSYKTLNELFNFYKFTGDEKNQCYAALVRLDYLNGDPDVEFADHNDFSVTSNYLGISFRIKYDGFVAFTDEMTADDVTTVEHNSIYSNSSYFLFGENSGRHVWASSYEYVLKLIVSNAGSFDHSVEDTVDAIFDFMDEYSHIVISMLLCGDKKEFFNNVQPDFFKILFLYFCDYTQKPTSPETADKVVDLLDGRKDKDRVTYARFLAWAKFQHFIRYGHPEKYYAQMPQDIPTVEGFILNAVILFQKGQYADAVKNAQGPPDLKRLQL